MILGSPIGIESDLNHIADSDTGVNFVDGRGIFICTFYSPYSVTEIYEKISHRTGMLLFDITTIDNYAVNLPSKYHLGLFPELSNILHQEVKTESVKKENTSTKKVKKNTEEFKDIDSILDKLSRNNYDRSCLTENEIKILNNK
jgi:hypothetical protein